MSGSLQMPFGRRVTRPVLRPRSPLPGLPQPLWTMDFVRHPTLAGGQGRPALTFVRGSDAWDPLRQVMVGPDTPRFNANGLLIEGQRRNYLHDSANPATQTRSLTAGTYTLWLEGTGTVALSGGPSGTASAGNPVTFTLAVTTSVTFTVSGAVDRFQCETDPDYTLIGVFVSSFIETPLADGATRKPDLVSSTDVSWFNPVEGTILSVVRYNTSKAELIASSNAQGIFTISDGSPNNRIDLNRNGVANAVRYVGSQAGLGIFLIDDDLPTKDRSINVTSYRSGHSAFFRDGGQALTETINDQYQPIVDANTVSVGNRFNTGSFLDGYFETVSYWPRALSNVTLRNISSDTR